MAEDNNLSDSEKSATTHATAHQTKKKKMALWKKIVIGLVVFVVALFGIAMFATSAPAKVSDKFVSYILGNQSEDAYSLFSEDAKETISKEDFSEVVNTMSSVLDSSFSQKSRSVQADSGSASTATIEYEIKGNDGVYQMEVNLIKENDDWKVLNMDNKLKNN